MIQGSRCEQAERAGGRLPSARFGLDQMLTYEMDQLGPVRLGRLELEPPSTYRGTEERLLTLGLLQPIAHGLYEPMSDRIGP